MLAILCAAAILHATPAVAADRLDVGERLKLAEVLWAGDSTRARRQRAVAQLRYASLAISRGDRSAACRRLDLAIAALEGRAPQVEDAVSLRFEPPYCEPSESGRLLIGWAYPTSGKPVRVSMGGRSVTVRPGERRSISVAASALNPDYARDPEAGVLVPVQVGANRRSAFLSVVKHFQRRLGALRDAANLCAKAIARMVTGRLGRGLEFDEPLIEPLFLAEELESGEASLASLEQLPSARQGSTVLRAAFPPKLEGSPTVVIALPDAGGSENTFFESCGRGAAMREALRRGWAFVGVADGETAAADALEWLRKVRGVEPERVFLIGRGKGADLALRAAALNPKAPAVALFAPDEGVLPVGSEEIAIFLAVGKQDAPERCMAARALAAKLQGAPTFQFRQLEPCEHLMVVGEAAGDAYRFLDAQAQAQGAGARGR